MAAPCSTTTTPCSSSAGSLRTSAAVLGDRPAGSLQDPPHRLGALQAFLTYDPASARMYRVEGPDRKEIHDLRPQEHKLIRYMDERNRAQGGEPVMCTYEEMIGAVWGNAAVHTEAEINHLVWELRKKIEPERVPGTCRPSRAWLELGDIMSERERGPALSMGWASDVGRVREGNEDTVKVDPSRGLAIIADGMGDTGQGRSRAVSRRRRSSAPSRRKIDLASSTPAEALSDALLAAHVAVQRAGALDASHRGMGTTVVIAWAAAESVWIAHVGDSRAYLLSENAATLLTEDHTVLNQIKKSGQLPADPSNGRRAGSCPRPSEWPLPLPLQIDRIDLMEGSRILLCSDGLTDMLDDREIGDLARTERRPSRRLCGTRRSSERAWREGQYICRSQNFVIQKGDRNEPGKDPVSRY